MISVLIDVVFQILDYLIVFLVFQRIKNTAND